MKEIEVRRSIRKYRDQEIEAEKIDRLMESARLAPSGNNSQPWHFILISDKDMKKRLSVVSHNQKWMESAPLFIACIADMSARLGAGSAASVDEETSSFDLKRSIRDTAIATEHIVLEAAHLGLGTCWVGWFTQEEIRPVLEIPGDKFLLCLLTVGYPDENPAPRPRKSIREIVSYNHWQG